MKCVRSFFSFRHFFFLPIIDKNRTHATISYGSSMSERANEYDANNKNTHSFIMRYEKCFFFIHLSSIYDTFMVFLKEFLTNLTFLFVNIMIHFHPQPKQHFSCAYKFMRKYLEIFPFHEFFLLFKYVRIFVCLIN